MDDSHSVPAVSAYEVEEFWAGFDAIDPRTGTPAQAAERTHPCSCGGIDFPGIGLAHTLSCSAARSMLRETGLAAAEPDGRAQLLAQLDGELRVAARALAESRIQARTSCVFGRSFLLTGCGECFTPALSETDNIDHRSECKTGRVLALLAEIEAVSKPAVGEKGSAL